MLLFATTDLVITIESDFFKPFFASSLKYLKLNILKNPCNDFIKPA